MPWGKAFKGWQDKLYIATDSLITLLTRKQIRKPITEQSTSIQGRSCVRFFLRSHLNPKAFFSNFSPLLFLFVKAFFLRRMRELKCGDSDRRMEGGEKCCEWSWQNRRFSFPPLFSWGRFHASLSLSLSGLISRPYVRYTAWSSLDPSLALSRIPVLRPSRNVNCIGWRP